VHVSGEVDVFERARWWGLKFNDEDLDIGRCSQTSGEINPELGI
jgi:hypothetical protein